MMSRVVLVAGCVAAGLSLVLAGASGGEPAAVARGRIARAAPTQQAPASTAGNKWLLVVGDSVIQGVPAYGGVPTLQAQLGPGWSPVVIDAAESRSTLSAPPLVQGDLRRIAPNTFDTVVIALGYNDGGAAAVFESRVKAVLDVLRSVPHVYWLTLRESGQFADGYHQSNIGLRSIIASYPNAAVLDWNEFSKTLPDSEFTVDGNHLSPKLAHVMASFIADAVNRKSLYLAAGPSTKPTSAPSSTTPRNAISTIGNSTPDAPGEHNGLLLGVLVSAVLLVSFAIAAWAGSRRMSARKRDERRTRLDEMFGVTDRDDATSSEEVEETDTADLGEAVRHEQAAAPEKEPADETAADDEVVEPTPVDATRPLRDEGP